MVDHGYVRSDKDCYSLINDPNKIRIVRNQKIYTTTQVDNLPETNETHPNFIAAELQEYSPGVNIYSVSKNNLEDVEWALLNCDIDLINASANFGSYNNYSTDSISIWFDTIVNFYDVTLIASAGNDKNWQSYGWPNVISPASCYNSIAVGAYKSNGIQEYDKMFDYRYNPTDSSNVVCYKPDVMIAAGSTSEAAPALTGIISMILEVKPSLSTNPELIKAIILASCHRKITPYSESTKESIYDGLTQRQGAGAVDAYKALEIVLQNHYGINSLTNSSEKHYCTIKTYSNTNVNISISWLKNNNFENGNIIMGNTNELKLNAYNNSELIKSSSKVNSGKQMVYFTANKGENYQFEVESNSNTTVQYAYAWSTANNCITLHTNDKFGVLSRDEVLSQLDKADIEINDRSHMFSVAFDKSVKYIGDSAFNGINNLENICFGENIHEIRKNSFSQCSGLYTVEIPDSVYSIDEEAFTKCYNLKEVTIGSSIKEIGENAFYHCFSLQSVRFMKLIAPTIKNNAFSGLASNAKGYVLDGALGYQDTYGSLSIIHNTDYRTVYFSNNKNWDEVKIFLWNETSSYYYTQIPMTYLYDNYLGEKVYSATFDYNLYNQMFFESGTEEEYTENINISESGTGYYLDGYNESGGKWSVSTYVPDVRTIYFTNTNKWSDVRAYLWKSGTIQNNIWHGAKMKYIATNSNEEDLYSITFDHKEYDYVVFNDYNSASQTTDIKIGENNIMYYLNGKKAGNKWMVSSSIYN